MPNQARHKNLTFFVANFAILQKKKKEEEGEKTWKIVFFSFRCVFSHKKRMSQIVTFTIIFFKEKNCHQASNFFKIQLNKGGVSHGGLAIYIKK